MRSSTCSLFYTPSPFARCAPSSQGPPRADPAKANPRLILEVLDESADLLAIFLRAVLLSCAIANAAAFIAPSRAPQWGRAAVLPPRALPTASVTRRGPTALSTFSTVEIEKELARRRQVDKRSDVLQVCPARTRWLEGISGMAPVPPQGVWGVEGKPGVHPKQVLVRPAPMFFLS